MSGPLYCRPSDILTDAATVSVVAGATATDYPVANISDRKAHSVAKSTGTGITYRAVFGVAKSIDAVALINTNATAVQLTNSAGLNVAIPIPTTPEDGLNIDPWIDLRAVANTSSTTWNIALTGPTGVALGEWLLVDTLRSIPVLWKGLEEEERHATIVHETDYGVRLRLGLGVRQRIKRGRLVRESFRPDLLSLRRDARGVLRSCLLLIDPSQNDALYGDLTTDTQTVERIFKTASGADVAFTEQQKGWL